jgi:osmotically-inducible protein OsmY
MKKMLKLGFTAVALLLMLGTTSCKKKVKDADIQAAIETVLKADAGMSNAMVTVTDGVATITGECKDEACKTNCETAIKAIEGVKSVVNNCTIAPVVAVVPPVADQLSQAIADALKDFPTVKSELKDGVLTLTGEVAKSSLQKMMMGLNALKTMGLKKIESASLVKK